MAGRVYGDENCCDALQGTSGHVRRRTGGVSRHSSGGTIWKSTWISIRDAVRITVNTTAGRTARVAAKITIRAAIVVAIVCSR